MTATSTHPEHTITPEETFWNWFKCNQAILMDFEDDQESIFDLLQTEMGKVNPHITFEFGPREAQRELVISAGGITEAFPAVVTLVDAAPPLAGWGFTAFRPRRWPLNTLEIAGLEFHPEDVEFSLLDNGYKAGIELFIPGFPEGLEESRQIGYLLLDDALGEFDVETKLGYIGMFPREHISAGKRYLLTELPRLFDNLVARLEGRSDTPS